MQFFPYPRLSFPTPIGWLTVEATGVGLRAATFHDDDAGSDAEPLPLLLEAKAQLDAYFAGGLQAFDLPLAPEGTPFQQQVWNTLLGVGFGQTRSYLDIALACATDKHTRAVGAANGQNPIAVIVPCHRIIGSNGSLTGYAGGMHRKKWLLAHEARQIPGAQTSLFG
jgi:methylated-DNA-[protein]-cysteine S-methyltransferase